MKKAAIFISILFIFILVSSANALTLSKVGGAWSNLSGGASLETFLQFYNDNSEVLWGRGVGYKQRKSGLRFTNASSQTIETDDAFLLGSLTHFNREIATGTEATAADLKITLEFEYGSTLSYAFDIAFQIEETPNTTPSLSDDYISFGYDAYLNQTFEIDGNDYSFSILGFRNSEGNFINQFASAESKRNTTDLYGILTASGLGQPVPEPAAFLLLSCGLIGLIAMKRRSV